MGIRGVKYVKTVWACFSQMVYHLRPLLHLYLKPIKFGSVQLIPSITAVPQLLYSGYESRTYTTVVIISQNIYCFGGGCATHLIPPFGVSSGLSNLSILSIRYSFCFAILQFQCAFLLYVLFYKWLEIVMLTICGNPDSAFVFHR